MWTSERWQSERSEKDSLYALLDAAQEVLRERNVTLELTLYSDKSCGAMIRETGHDGDELAAPNSLESSIFWTILGYLWDAP